MPGPERGLAGRRNRRTDTEKGEREREREEREGEKEKKRESVSEKGTMTTRIPSACRQRSQQGTLVTLSHMVGQCKAGLVIPFHTLSALIHFTSTLLV